MNDIFFHPLPQQNTGTVEYFSVLGRALFTAQHFETNCRALAGFLMMKTEQVENGSNVLDSPKFHLKINKLWKQNLGNIIPRITKSNPPSNDISQVLDEARVARNEIAHWITVGVNIESDAELSNRIDEIRIHVQKIAYADKYVAALLHKVNKTSLPSDQFFTNYEKEVADWACEPVSLGC